MRVLDCNWGWALPGTSGSGVDRFLHHMLKAKSRIITLRLLKRLLSCQSMKRTLFIAALTCASMHAGEHHASRLWKASIAALGAGIASDLATSAGRYETNPLLRGNGLGVNPTRAVAFKIAPAAAVIGVEALILHRNRGVAGRGFAVVNFASAGLLTATAVHNTTIAPIK